MSSPTLLTVSQLCSTLTHLFEEQLPMLWVEGEIANFVEASSGHCYFTLKDERSAIRAVLFRRQAAQLSFSPKSGDKVQVYARVSVYQARGDLQLQVAQMRLAGQGNLYEQFLRIRDRLQAEGLFEAGRKRSIPTYPQRVGVITSPQAAALQDVLTALRRRAPQFEIVLYPSLVQGREAVAQLQAALALASLRQEVDVLLLVRGGGSFEDLWCFNDEALARQIALCPIPIVTGIGHETDSTIADFVADLRAPTPTAAAELISAGALRLAQQLGQVYDQLQRSIKRRLADDTMRFDALTLRLVPPQRLLVQYEAGRLQWQQRLQRAVVQQLEHKRQQSVGLILRLSHKAPKIEREHQSLLQWQARLQRAIGLQLSQQRQRFEHYAQLLHHTNPRHVVQRGFSIVYDAQGQIVHQADALTVGDQLQVEFARGQAAVQVISLSITN